MKNSIAAAAAAAMFGLLVSGQQARSDDCDDLVTSVETAVEVASKVLEQNMADITKVKPSDDKEKASVMNRFCSASGEFLGFSRAYRVVVSECLRGSKRRDTVASLTKSIRSLEDSIIDTCK